MKRKSLLCFLEKKIWLLSFSSLATNHVTFFFFGVQNNSVIPGIAELIALGVFFFNHVH
jgi:hypothetical protein